MSRQLRTAAKALLVGFCLSFSAASIAATTVNLTKSLTASANPIDSGVPFNYTLSWSCPGSVSPADDCINTVITDTLPATLQATALPAADGKLLKVCVQAPAAPAPNLVTCTQPAVSTGSPTAAGSTLYFVFVNRVLAGDSGSLSMQAWFAPGTTPNGATATNGATISANCDTVAVPGCANATPVTANAPPITAIASNKVSLVKTVTSNSAIGYNFGYRIRACPNTSSGTATGYITPTNLVLVDTLPANATFVSATGGGTFAAGAVTWNVASLPSCTNFDVVVNFPAATNAPCAACRTNNADLTYDVPGVATGLTLNAFVTHNLAGPAPGMGGSSKNTSDAVVNPGQSITFTITANNNGNVPLGMRIVDPIPPACEVTGFNVGTGGNAATAWTVTKQDASVLSFTNPPDAPGAITAASVGATAVNRITDITADFGDSGNPVVGAGSSRTLTITCTVIQPDRNGASPALPYTMTNTATLSGANGPDTVAAFNLPRNVTIRDAVGNPTFQPDAAKTKVSPAGNLVPGGSATFRIAMTNSGSYSSPLEQVALVEPVFADLLPTGMSFTSSLIFGAPPVTCAVPPAITQVANYNGTGRTLVIWSWIGTGCSLARGDTITYDLAVALGATLPAGAGTNNVAFMGGGNPPTDIRGTESCATTGGFLASTATVSSATWQGNKAGNAAAGNADATTLCHAGSVGYTVQRITNVSSRKAVKGQLDPAFLFNTAEPLNVGRTVRDGYMTWRLELNNTANIALDRIEMIDIVPFAATANPAGTTNTGVGTGAQLGTTWSPEFLREIDISAAPPGTKVYYTNAPNPCRPAIAAVAGCNPMTTLADGVPLADETAVPNAGQAGQWTTVLPNSPEFTFAFRIVFPPAYLLPPGETLGFEFPMHAPADAPISNCVAAATSACSNIAWNTFGFSYREADSLIANGSAPTRVGIIVQAVPPGLAAVGDFVWFDTNQDGIQDAAESANGINNVLVQLWSDPDGVPNNGDELLVAEQNTTQHPTTNLPGYYHFPALVPSIGAQCYFIRFHPPAGFTGSPNDVGADASDSDGVSTVVGVDTLYQTSCFTLAIGQDDLTRDQGFYQPAPTFSLGNRVFLDNNNDNLDNDGAGNTPGSSTGVAGVTVQLWAVDGTGTPTAGAPAASLVTNATGHYLFTGIAAGAYRVVIPPGMLVTGAPLANLFSSATSRDVAGLLQEGAPSAGNSDVDAVDHGSLTAAALGAIAAGSVISGSVSLGPTASEPTNEIGTVGPSQTPGYYDLTANNRSNLTIDFGFYALSLGNRLWIDLNNNAVLDAGEPGVANVVVQVLDGTSSVIGVSTTDANGYWRVDGLVNGTYRVRVPEFNFAAGQALQGYLSSTGVFNGSAIASDNRDHGIDDPAPAINGIASATFTVATGVTGETIGASGNALHGPLGDAADNLTIDFGFVVNGAGAVSGCAWRDFDHDRLKDAGEPPLVGYTVELLNNLGVVIRTVLTDGTGCYLHSGLPPGTYGIRFRDPTNNQVLGQPAPQGGVGNGTGTPNGIINITVGVGLTVVEQNLPLDPAGVVYDETTRVPLAGATVTISGPPGFNPAIHLIGGIAAQVTDASGMYQFLLFPAAPAGTYTLTITPPPGYQPSHVPPNPALVPPVLPGGPFLVQPTPLPPTAGNPVTPYYLQFNLVPGVSQDVVNNHIPLLQPALGVTNNIPTMNEWMLLLLATLMLGIGGMRVRTRK